jgi:cyclase
VIDHVVSAEKAGAGEILINSVDRDGLMTGMDIKIINELNKLINIPIIACGGAGNLEHVKNAMEAGANAIAAGSMFVFHGNQKGILINYPEKDQLEKFLK